MKKKTPAKRNKEAIEKCYEIMNVNLHCMGHLAEDLYCDVIDKEYYDNEIEQLFWERSRTRDLIRILEGE